MKLDITIIATIRADILRMTLASFANKFLHQFDCRAIINVDPAGETDRNNQMDMVDICREYFADVVYRTPKQPSFSDAVKWVWQQVETEFFFHLEDDWILKESVTAEQMFRYFNDENVVSVTLNKYAVHKALHDDEEYFIAEYYDPQHIYLKSISLNPSVFRSQYTKDIVHHLDTAQDPEIQFIDNNTTALYPSPLFLWRVSQKPIIIDTGTKWRKANSIRKAMGDGITTEWVAIHNQIIRDYNRKIRRTVYYLITKQYWQSRYCRPLYPTIRL